MLKRQRPASPVGSASAYLDDQDLFHPNYPVYNNSWAAQASTSNNGTTDIDSDYGHRKRRRTVAPSLDGHVREQKMDMTLSPQTQLDDDDAEEDIDYEGEEEAPSAEEYYLDQNKHAMRLYKETNSFLHDLHAEQQHRRLFSITHAGPSLVNDHDHANAVASEYTSTSLHKLHPEPPMIGSEERTVKETYEDRNRLLGSLFLTRRKELGDGEGGST